MTLALPMLLVRNMSICRILGLCSPALPHNIWAIYRSPFDEKETPDAMQTM